MRATIRRNGWGVCSLGGLVALALLLQPAGQAFALPLRSEYRAVDYSHAASAPSYIRFHMVDTKLGLLTMSFDGYVKAFALIADVQGDQAEGVRLHFPVRALDTDVGLRNRKMFDYCLAADQHPTIQVALQGPVQLDGSTHSVPALLTVRGKGHPVQVQVSIAEQGGSFVVQGSTTLSLSSLEIPDPSIPIATVHDAFDVQFRLVVPKTALAKA
jgi:polyisoprenoid-binding protein YceI